MECGPWFLNLIRSDPANFAGEGAIHRVPCVLTQDEAVTEILKAAHVDVIPVDARQTEAKTPAAAWRKSHNLNHVLATTVILLPIQDVNAL